MLIIIIDKYSVERASSAMARDKRNSRQAWGKLEASSRQARGKLGASSGQA